jgi:heptosyltransferase-2
MSKDILKKAYLFLRGMLLGLVVKPSRGTLPSKDNIKILVIRIDRIGDMVLSTPIFKLLRKKFPKADISVLTRNAVADIINNNPHINRVFSYTGFFNTISAHRNKYDLVIDLFNEYLLETALISRFINAPFSLGFDVEKRGRLFTNPIVPGKENRHFIESTLQLLEPLGISVSERTDPEIFAKPDYITVAQSCLSRNGINKDHVLIAIHPGGYYGSQRWPDTYFVNLIELITDSLQNVKFVILGSTQEMALLDTIYKGLNAKTRAHIAINAEDSLNSTVALLSLSKLFIGNNSGLLHIAAALKVPTVSFMGPTIPWKWSPWGPRETNVVFKKDLSCSPCNKGVCREHECLNTISPTEVFDTIKQLLSNVIRQPVEGK